MTSQLDSALQSVPVGLRRPLVETYMGALSKYTSRDWEALGTKAGKFCEVTYSILSGTTSGAYSDRPEKPRNMVDACNALAGHSKSHGRAVCIQIPRVLIAVYEFRNNRGLAHVGSTVDPSHMDSEFLIRCVKWLMAEMVRNFGDLSSDDSQDLIDGITERTSHVIWEVAGTKRILNRSMTIAKRVLALTYAEGGVAQVEQLCEWSEYSHGMIYFEASVLRPLHGSVLIHHDKASNTVTLSPLGTELVEVEKLLTRP